MEYKEMTYKDAVNLAMTEEMRKDENVIFIRRRRRSLWRCLRCIRRNVRRIRTGSELKTPPFQKRLSQVVQPVRP